MKTCTKCKIEKQDAEFTARVYKSGHRGLRSMCNICKNAAREKWRKENPSDNERNKKYNRTHAEEIRGRKLSRKYWPSLSWEKAIAEWNRLFAAQGGHCAFCPTSNRLHVDHCHNTGKVRGLLCYNCNNGLGRFKDSIPILMNAVDYLEKSK